MRSFLIQDILSVATGTLCGTMDGIYIVCNYLTKDKLSTHQLPRAFEFCSPIIYEQYPDLKEADLSNLNKNTLAAKISEWAGQFGELLPLTNERAGEWKHKNPIVELAQMLDAK